MIVWMLLAMSFLISVAGVAMTAANAEAAAASKAAMSKHGIGGCSSLVVMVLGGLAMAVLWTWYAIDVGDWRFAAIVWLPLIARLIGSSTKRRFKP